MTEMASASLAEFDYRRVIEGASLVVDARNATLGDSNPDGPGSLAVGRTETAPWPA
jgi:hypothetical protein